jgi:hypothetical protein
MACAHCTAFTALGNCAIRLSPTLPNSLPSNSLYQLLKERASNLERSHGAGLSTPIRRLYSTTSAAESSDLSSVLQHGAFRAPRAAPSIAPVISPSPDEIFSDGVAVSPA